MAADHDIRLDPRSVYWFVCDCPCCGRRVRASSLLRHWQKGPASFEDAEVMLTVSRGYKALENVRGPFWRALRDAGWEQRDALAPKVEDFLRQLEDRLRAAAQVARDAARRARYG